MSSFIQEKIGGALQNNTAQREVYRILESLKKDILILNIQTPLSGNLDLSILHTQGYQQLHTICFSKGELTSIRNIPPTISTLKCSDNLLIELNDLPASIRHLECNYNYLTKFDFSNTPYMEEMYCNGNKITEFLNISKTSKSLTALYCDKNKLKSIDLQGLDNLRTLHISDNPLIIVDNLPENVVDFVSNNNHIASVIHHSKGGTREGENDIDEEEENENQQVKQKDIRKKINYLEALDKYFKLKNKYEEKVKKMKKNVFYKSLTKKEGKKQVLKIKPECIYCKRPVGTIFSVSKTHYHAVCGNRKDPCSLNIQLFRGDFQFNEYFLYLFKETLEEDKQTIIVQKMDTLFNYISERQSSELFKKNIENYNNDSSIYNERLKHHNDIYHNSDTKELIDRKMERIVETQEKMDEMIKDYASSKNTETLKTAINMYVYDLKPEIENVRRLKYKITEVEQEVVKTDVNLNILYQNVISLSDIEYTYGEPPKVLHFIH
jgi:hypothetical protein